jgi:uncharacterized protein YecE (DUF72 family)
MMHAMGGHFYLGTSGFAYDEWRKGVFYPEDLKKDDMLAYYSSQLSSVEINYTFRRFPSEKTLTTWRERAADGFVFTLKANQRITHWKKLKDVGDDVRDFLARASLLEDRLGCVLFQCPPTLVYDADLLEGFLATLPSFGGPAFAMEFRHASWAEARARLLEAGGRMVRRRDRRARPEARGPFMGAGRLPPSAQDRVHGRGTRDMGGQDRPRGRRRRPGVRVLQARGSRGKSADGEAP